MDVDVCSEITIDRSPAEVYAYAADPNNAPEWYENIESVGWETPPPLAVGSRLAFVAHFLGRRLTYTYEVTDLTPGEQLVMRTAQGPFPMETTYRFQAAPGGGTKMILRNRGEPAGFVRLAALFMRRVMKRENRKDLSRIKQILEGPRRSARRPLSAEPGNEPHKRQRDERAA